MGGEGTVTIGEIRHYKCQEMKHPRCASLNEDEEGLAGRQQIKRPLVDLFVLIATFKLKKIGHLSYQSTAKRLYMYDFVIHINKLVAITTYRQRNEFDLHF